MQVYWARRVIFFLVMELVKSLGFQLGIVLFVLGIADYI